MQNVKLNNGVEIPILGLGTWKTPEGTVAFHSVLWALQNGYRHIDTAAIYGNEESVGKAIKSSGIPREEIFVTTKIWNADHKDPKKALDTRLKKLGMSYVDLYLIHWPVPQREQTWRAFETFLKEGICRSIGVSNFTIAHLEKLLKSSNTIPSVNQVEFNPFLYQKELLDYCKHHKIQLEAYSPLSHGQRLNDKDIKSIGNRYSKTPAQVMLRWAVQKKIVVIPKSVNKERIIENSKIFDFELSKNDMTLLDNMNEDFRTCWDPTNIQ